MLVMDMPDIPPQYVPVMVVQASQARQDSTAATRTIGVCRLIENPPSIPGGSAVNSIGSPLGSLRRYFSEFEHRTIPEGPARVTLLERPAHGVLKPEGDFGSYLYLPNAGFLGQDQATFTVEVGEIKTKVIYFFSVSNAPVGGNDVYDPYQDKELCPNGVRWKISLNPDDPNARPSTPSSVRPS